MIKSTTTLTNQKASCHFLFIILSILFLPMVSYADTITVINTDDFGAGSFRQATFDAVDGDVINFAMNVTEIKPGSFGEFFINENVSIDGSTTSTGMLILDGTDLPANARLMFININKTVNITNVHFRNSGTLGTTSGPAIHASGSMLILENCEITDCKGQLGAVRIQNGSVDLLNCKFIGNESSQFGGGLNARVGTNYAKNCVFMDNTSANGGGGMTNESGSWYMYNCTFLNNSATAGSGGGIQNNGTMVELVNTILHNNTAGGSGPDLYSTITNITSATNNLLGNFDNSGLTDGNNFNVSGDPLISAGAYVLSDVDSPCVDAGTTYNTIPLLDLDGEPRIHHCTMDMGCTEYQGTDFTPSNLVVTNVFDDGVGSLRGTIECAISGDTVSFSPSINNQLIKLNTGQIIINKNLTIVGNGIANTIIDGSMASDAGLFKVNANKTVHFEGLTMQHGGGASYTGPGAAIETHGAAVSILKCKFSNNNNSSATSSGNTIEQFDGNLKIVNCEFLQNGQLVNGGGECLIVSRGANTTTEIHQCLIWDNDISSSTIITLGDASLNFSQNTFFSDQGDQGITLVGAGTHVIKNNIIDSAGDLLFIATGAATTGHNLLSHTDSELPSSDGNLVGMSDFVNAPGGNFSLSNGSDAISNGDDTALPIDVLDINNNDNITETLPTDFLDGLRKQGCGTNVDIGAFEANDTGSLEVTNNRDDGNGSLRYEIACAPVGSTITFEQFIGNIQPTSGEIVIDKNLSLLGNGPDLTIIDGSMDVGQDSRIFIVTIGKTLNLESLKIQNAGEPAMVNLWGGVILSDGDLNITDCVFDNNRANLGGVMRIVNGHLNITSSIFSNNEATRFGGVIDSRGVEHSAHNCLFNNNTSGDTGGAIYNEEVATWNIFNCTFANNTSTTGYGGAMVGGFAIGSFINNIFFGNTAPLSSDLDQQANGFVDARNNLLEHYTNSGLTSGTNGNITGDPMFVGTGDYSLAVGSPCINAGTSYSNIPTIDLAGNAREVSCNPDMGAYEEQTLFMPQNDLCFDATPISLDDNLLDEYTICANNIGVANLACSSLGQGVWYKFEPTTNGKAAVEVNPDMWDCELVVASSTNCINFTNIACEDSGSTGNAETVEFGFSANTLYYIFVGDPSISNTNFGNFDISLTEIPSGFEFDFLISGCGEYDNSMALFINPISYGNANTVDISHNFSSDDFIDRSSSSYYLGRFDFDDIVTVTITDHADPSCFEILTITMPSGCPPENESSPKRIYCGENLRDETTINSSNGLLDTRDIDCAVGEGVWYTFYPRSVGSATLEMSPQNWDAKLIVQEINKASNNKINQCIDVGQSGDPETITFDYNPDHYYYFYVGDPEVNDITNTGLFDLSLSCVDCSPNFEVFIDQSTCPGSYDVIVDVTNLNGATGVEISNDFDNQTFSNEPLGQYTFTGFAANDTIVISTSANNNLSCTVHKSIITPNGVCPPVNNTCINAIEIFESTSNCTHPESSSLADATTSNNSGRPDVWFKYTGGSQQVSIELSNYGESFSYNTYIYELDCESLIYVLASSGNLITFYPELGKEYLIRVSGGYYTEIYSDFDICIYPCAATINSCAASALLTESDDDSCSNSDLQSTFCIDNSEFWHHLTPTQSGVYTIEVSPESANNIAAINIYEGNCGSLTYLLGEYNTMNIELVAGQLYKIRTFLYNENTYATVQENFSICAYTCPSSPNNPVCNSAEILLESTDENCNNSKTGSTYCSSNKNVWYTFTPNQSSTYFFDADAHSDDHYICYVIYQNCNLANYVAYGCNESLAIDLVQGEDYLIQVYVGYKGTSISVEDNFDLCVYPCNQVIPVSEVSNAETLNLSSNNSCDQQLMGSTFCAATNTIWYKFTPSVTDEYTILTEALTPEMICQISIYSQDIFQSLGLNFHDALLTADVEYVIRIKVFGTTPQGVFKRGEFNICIFQGAHCPPDFAEANGNALILDEKNHADYETDGVLDSRARIFPDQIVSYDSGTEINLLPGFTTEDGVTFEAYIDGCGPSTFRGTDEPNSKSFITDLKDNLMGTNSMGPHIMNKIEFPNHLKEPIHLDQIDELKMEDQHILLRPYR